MRYVLGLDIGTTSTIGILIRPDGPVCGLVSRPVALSSPRAGWSEEDPNQWWLNVRSIVAELLATGVDASQIGAIGVTGMVPALVLLDAEGVLLRPSIQQSDARCGTEVEELRAEVDPAIFLRRAGNGINQQLAAPKLRWLRKHEPAVFERIATVFGSYDYINWRLTGERAVEQNWALESGFVEIHSNCVADDLIDLAQISRSALPRKVASDAIVGEVSPAAARETGLAPGTPVVGGAADIVASALCAGITNSGDVLLKFGGSLDILIATARAITDPRMYLDYHLVPGLYMPNGSMSTGGSALNWFAMTFASAEAITAAARGLSVHQYLDGLAARIPAGSAGVTVLPYFLGEKTPIHDPRARGVFSGLSLSHGLGHLWRALLEGYAFAFAHHVEVLRDIGHSTERFFASDGGSSSLVWMQIVADVLQRPIQLLRGHPGSCLGAAWTAAMGTGLAQEWSGISRFVQLAERIEPNPDNAGVYAGGYRIFRGLYRPTPPASHERYPNP